MPLIIVLLVAMLALHGCATQVDTRYTQKSTEERVAAWNSVAREYIQTGQLEQAKRPLKRALEIDDKAAESLALMALVFQQQQEHEIADQYYRDALSSDADNARINNNYGIFLLLRERYDEACGYLAKAAGDSLYGQRTQALENLAACYKAAGQPEQSEATYRQVLRVNPDSARALIELAEIAYDRQDSARSWELFDQFSRLVRNRLVEHSAKSLWLGVRLSRLAEDASKAATYALLLKSSYPDSPEYQQYKESR